MTKRRILFLSLFALFQVTVFVFTMYVESKREDFNFLLDMMKKINYFKYGALFGVIFIAIEIWWARAESRKS